MILHVDLDAFYASVEQLDDPALRGKPVIVGGLGNRGVVSTASYEARAYGVHSAMPMTQARRACPGGVFVPPRFDRYSVKSAEVMEIFRSLTPLVEPLSIDEAFLDVTGARRHFGTGEQIATLVRRRVYDETGLNASVGVATTKFLAKLASDLAKPDGLLVVVPGSEVDFLTPLPVTRLWGVGPATFAKLERMGIRTIGDVARLPVDALTTALGSSLGVHLYALAHNDDPRPVVPDAEAKSIGAEETFGADLRDRPACNRELLRLSERTAARLRHAKQFARTITLKVRFADFETRTRARTLAEPSGGATALYDIARELLDEFDVARGIRLLGVSASNLQDPPPEQGTLVLDDDPTGTHSTRVAAAERAAEAVRERFGDRAVRPATLLETPERKP